MAKLLSTDGASSPPFS